MLKNSLQVCVFSFSRVREALTYLVYAYQSNSTLLRNGENRGVEESLIALYRRKCLMVSDQCSSIYVYIFCDVPR